MSRCVRTGFVGVQKLHGHGRDETVQFMLADLVLSSGSAGRVGADNLLLAFVKAGPHVLL